MDQKLAELREALALIDRYDDPEFAIIGRRLSEFIRNYKTKQEDDHV